MGIVLAAALCWALANLASAASGPAVACVRDAHTDADAATCAGGLRGGTLDLEDTRKAIEAAMLSGRYLAAVELVGVARAANADVASVVHQTAGRIRASLATVQEALSSTAANEGISPAFEWAQSPSQVFLNFKFAHKMDAPATLGCSARSVFGERSLAFQADCPSKKKTFKLSLSTFAALDPDACTHVEASVGRAIVTLRKAENGTWPRLLSSGKRPGNMHVWWAMNERWENATKEFEKERDRAAKERREATLPPTPPPAAAEASAEVPAPTSGADAEGGAIPSAGSDSFDQAGAAEAAGDSSGEGATDFGAPLAEERAEL